MSHLKYALKCILHIYNKHCIHGPINIVAFKYWICGNTKFLSDIKSENES